MSSLSKSSSTRSLVVDLSISAGKLETMYRGRTRTVLAWSEDGRSVRFPIQILRPFVARDGVRGRFLLALNGQNRLQKITRLSFNGTGS